jgi:hypothetical protein
MDLLEIQAYTANAVKIDTVIYLDIILKIVLVGVSLIFIGSLLIGKFLVLLSNDKEIDSFFYSKSINMPFYKLNLFTVLYFVVTLLYFLVGRPLLREYISAITNNNYNYLDNAHPESKLFKK